MTTADSLNLDVLEQIFCFLAHRNLPSVALVNRSFSAAVASRLYKSISYRLRLSKGYINVGSYSNLYFANTNMHRKGETMSPFAVILAHPRLGVYVRHIGNLALQKTCHRRITKFMYQRSAPSHTSSLCLYHMQHSCENVVVHYNYAIT
jgi:hypothetical protein